MLRVNLPTYLLDLVPGFADLNDHRREGIKYQWWNLEWMLQIPECQEETV